ncbi:MAG TPA: phosphate ABC transporter substrate-binding protein PstS [Galbitalea sp.]|nr:phosphate ABC transporter substrate-binding protein PstS [Galbitalea sp.]
MKLKNVAAVGAIALVTAIALSSCSSTPAPKSTATKSAAPTVDLSTLSGTITSGGSSAQANAQAAWTAAFTSVATGVTINYDKSQGSGGGVTNWLAGSYDFGGSDAALNPTQVTSAVTTCGAGGGIDVPVYLSGVNIIYNLPGVSKLNLDSATIANIFNKKITSWSDPAIRALNPGVTLPSNPITPVVRADGSGTTANFTTYLSESQPTLWPYPASTAWPVTGESAQQGGSGIVSTVTAGAYTIGYADQSSAATTPAADLQLGTSKTFVHYSAAGATKAFAAAASAVPTATGDLSEHLDYTKITSAGSYPIPLLSYDILCSQFKDPTQAKLAVAYIGFIDSTNGQAVSAKNAGSAPLPASILADVAKSLKLIK